jgi:hypothetical protein
MRLAAISGFLLVVGLAAPAIGLAVEIEFEGVSAPAQETVFSGTPYAEQGFELTGSPDFSVLSRTFPGTGITPESDYGYVHDAPAFALQRANGQQFSIQCLHAAQINTAEDGRLTVSGTRVDGRVLTEVFTTVSNELNLLVLPNVWNGLTAVSFSSDTNFLAIDRIRLDEADCLPAGLHPGTHIRRQPGFVDYATGYDQSPADGEFDEVRRMGDGNFRTVLNGSSEYRTNFEMNLGSVPAGSVVRSATLRFKFWNFAPEDRNIDLFGYRAGGFIDLSDFTRGDLLEGRVAPPDTHLDMVYDVTAFVDEIVASGTLPHWAGFSVRHRDPTGGLIMELTDTPVLELVFETVDQELPYAAFAEAEDFGPADGTFDSLDQTPPASATPAGLINNGFVESRLVIEYGLENVPAGAVLERASLRFEGDFHVSEDRLLAIHGYQGDGVASLSDAETEAFRFLYDIPVDAGTYEHFKAIDVTSEVQRWLYEGFSHGGLTIRDITATQPNVIYRLFSQPVLDLVFREAEPDPASMAWWPFDSDAGDASGNGNHGTLSAGASITPDGQIGGALDLRDVEGYVRLDRSPIIDSPQCTISYWVSTDSLSADGYNAIFAHDRFDPGAVHANLVTGAEIAELAVAYFIGGNGYMDLQAGETWTHFAFSFDSVDNYLDLFLNGAWVGRHYPGGSSTCGNAAAAAIGAWDDTGTGTFGRFHDGRIDELKIYDQVLVPLQAEVAGFRELIFRDGAEDR